MLLYSKMAASGRKKTVKLLLCPQKSCSLKKKQISLDLLASKEKEAGELSVRDHMNIQTEHLATLCEEMGKIQKEVPYIDFLSSQFTHGDK